MGGETIEDYMADRELDEDTFLERHPWPVLVISTPGRATCVPIRPRDGADTDRITVGRAPEVDVLLAHESISKIHAELSWDPERERCVLTDLGSKNGTFADGRRLPPQGHERLASGATVGFGSLSARFLAPRDFRLWLASAAREREAG